MNGVDLGTSELNLNLRSIIEINEGNSIQFNESSIARKFDDENNRTNNNNEKKNYFKNEHANKSQSDDDYTDVDSEADINDNISITSSLDGLSLSQISFHAPLTAFIKLT